MVLAAAEDENIPRCNTSGLYMVDTMDKEVVVRNIMIRRVHYDESAPGFHLRGFALRRHCWALLVQRLACWIRGHHLYAWEPDWKDWFCTVCYQLFEDKPPPEMFEDMQ